MRRRNTASSCTMHDGRKEGGERGRGWIMVVVFAPNPSAASAATLLNCTDPLVGRGRKIEDVVGG